MKLFLMFFAGLVVAFSSGAKAPNIVMILCDDLGYGQIQYLNPERSKVPTPHVDQLAAEGMIFTDAHSGSSVCTPTRYGLMTGRYAWRTRLQKGVLSHGDPLIDKKWKTVPSLLQDAGYHTACLGKWHLGMTYTHDDGAPMHVKASKERYGAPVGANVVGSPVEFGFDYYYGFSYARSMRSMIENKKVVADLELDQNLDVLATKAEHYIAAQSKTESPFFLYVALGAPHTPIVPSTEWIGKSGMGEYSDFVMETDHAAGRVIEALEEYGVADNTLVLFSSDNGCSAGPAKASKLQADFGHYPSANLRGYKSDLWDGGHRVPFIVRWPGTVKAGSSSSQLICLTDLMATCAALTVQELGEHEGVDSFSFLPTLTDPNAVSRDSAIHHSIQGNFSIRQGKWKLLVSHGSGGWTKPKNDQSMKEGLPAMQLYDMEADIGESNNLINEHPERAERLYKALKLQVETGRSTPGIALKNDVRVKIDKQ